METSATESQSLPSESFDLRVFDPKAVRLFRVAGVTRLTWENERSWLKVFAARAFPISDPDHYIGLLDGLGKDVGLIIEPDQLDPESRKMLDEELEKRYFVPVVKEIVSIKEEFGAVYWTLETSRGRVEIVVRNVRDNLQEIPGSPRVLITDVDGNRFEFPDVTVLDPKSQDIIMRNL